MYSQDMYLDMSCVKSATHVSWLPGNMQDMFYGFKEQRVSRNRVVFQVWCQETELCSKCGFKKQICAPGVDGLSRKIQEVKDFVDERVDALSRKQDSLGQGQDEMKGQLDDVQDGVESVRHTCC